MLRVHRAAGITTTGDNAMNAPLPAAALPHGSELSLDDKYTVKEGRIYLSGTQALVRLPLIQKARDTAAGLNTAGFISGYRGSPLGAYDQALRPRKSVGR